MSQSLGTKGNILKTAVKFASKEGMEAISIGKVAALVGMSKSGLFGHFKSKQKMQIEMLELVSKRFTDKVIIPAIKEKRGTPRLRAFYLNWKSWIAGSSEFPGGCLLIATSSEVDDRPGDVKSFLLEQQGLLIKSLEKSIRICIEEGEFNTNLDVAQFAWNWYSIILGFHHYYRLMNHTKAEEFADHAFEGLVRLALVVKSPEKTAENSAKKAAEKT